MSYAAALTQTAQTAPIAQTAQTITFIVPEAVQTFLGGAQEIVQKNNSEIDDLEEVVKKSLERISFLKEQNIAVVNCLSLVNKQTALAICEAPVQIKEAKEEVKETKTVKAPPKVGLPKVQPKTKKQTFTKALYCNFCKEEGHSLFKCNNLPVCNDCGRKGHNADSCHNSCRNCGLPNHSTANCFAPKK